MFVETLNQVTDQTRRECQGSKSFTDYLSRAISIWCNQLRISQDITDYIWRGYSQHGIITLTGYIHKQGTTEMINWKIPTPLGEASTSFTVKNQFYQHINDFFNRINIRSDNIKFIVLIAFGITAIGYFIYILNQQKKQQITHGEEARQPKSYPPGTSISKVPTPPSPTPTGQKITKESLVLVLVISASQAEFLESLKDKKHIDVSEGEQLYKITRYLWLGSETELSQKIHDINQYSVSKEAESEYNIYLVEIKLKQDDEGFKPNVNQIDRYDAFRKLDDLAVEVKVSERLQIKAYEKLEVYNR